MIYTCYEMIRDCRAGKSEGWTHFVSHYVPIVRSLAGRGEIDDVVLALSRPSPGIFRDMAPAPERIFVAELRRAMAAALAAGTAAPGVEPSAVLAALGPHSVLERQAIWLATFGYDAAETARMLRSDVKMVETAREAVAHAINAWAGIAVGKAGPDRLPAKVFLDTIDGRSTWRVRSTAEAHLAGCLHCLDRYCRMHEAGHLLRIRVPLTEGETAHYLELLGVSAAKPAKGWKRIFGAAG